jgi:chromosome segregation ATPase
MLVLGATVCVCPPLRAAAERASGPAKREAKAAKAPEVTQEINALIEAQRSLAADISQLRDQLNALQQGVGEGHDEVRQNRDLLQTSLEQIKDMREEVRGLYVESSGLKGDIAQVGKQVEELDASLGNFRLSSGIVVAVVIVLQVVLVGLMFRGRRE